MVTAFQYKSKVEISYDYILEKIMALQLKAGDILQIQFEAVKGSVYLELKSPGGTTLYVPVTVRK